MTDAQIAAALDEVGAGWLMDDADEFSQSNAIRHLVMVAMNAARDEQMDVRQALGEVEFVRVTGEGHFGRIKKKDAFVYSLKEPR